MYNTGDIIRMKKPHPCGSYEWEILRVGMDFRLRCQGCQHLVMMPRSQFNKRVKKIIYSASEEAGQDGGQD